MREYRKLSAAKQDTRPVEQAIIFYAGWLGHYVGDGSQPLHTTIQYNGWMGPNPNGYTTGHQIHWQFEGPFVDANMHEPEVRAKMTPAKAIDGDIFDAYVAYLRHTKTYVEKVYQLEKAGGFVGAGSAESRAFTAERLGAGASMLRDMIYTPGWRARSRCPILTRGSEWPPTLATMLDWRLFVFLIPDPCFPIPASQSPASAAARAGTRRSSKVSIAVNRMTAGMAISSQASTASPANPPSRVMRLRGEECSSAPAWIVWPEPRPNRCPPSRTKGTSRTSCSGIAAQLAAWMTGKFSRNVSAAIMHRAEVTPIIGMQPMAMPSARVSASRSGETPCRSHSAALRLIVLMARALITSSLSVRLAILYSSRIKLW